MTFSGAGKSNYRRRINKFILKFLQTLAHLLKVIVYEVGTFLCFCPAAWTNVSRQGIKHKKLPLPVPSHTSCKEKSLPTLSAHLSKRAA